MKRIWPANRANYAKLLTGIVFASFALFAGTLVHAEVSRSHGKALLGMRLAGLRNAVPGGTLREWADIKLYEWDNPGSPDIHVCAQIYKDRVYRIVALYDPKYGRTRFMDFVAFVRFETGRRPRWMVETAEHRIVGIWQDNRTRLELWEPGANTASYTAVYFDLKNEKGLIESQSKPQSIRWRACGGDQR